MTFSQFSSAISRKLSFHCIALHNVVPLKDIQCRIKTASSKKKKPVDFPQASKSDTLPLGEKPSTYTENGMSFLLNSSSISSNSVVTLPSSV